MRPTSSDASAYQAPAFLHEAEELTKALQALSPTELQAYMQLSAPKAIQTADLISTWNSDAASARPAIDAFLGDIYSGLQVQSFNTADRAYANEHLLILSGLYGGLKALDSIHPYRLEMGYKFPHGSYKNLYEFWGSKIATLIPHTHLVINLSAVEYTKAVLPHLPNPVITPKFLTVSPKSKQPTFVTVHAKIARGAFAHWLIKNRITSLTELASFQSLGYHYDPSLSSAEQAVFVCQTFEGLGLSVRKSFD